MGAAGRFAFEVDSELCAGEAVALIVTTPSGGPANPDLGGGRA